MENERREFIPLLNNSRYGGEPGLDSQAKHRGLLVLPSRATILQYNKEKGRFDWAKQIGHVDDIVIEDGQAIAKVRLLDSSGKPDNNKRFEFGFAEEDTELITKIKEVIEAAKPVSKNFAFVRKVEA